MLTSLANGLSTGGLAVVARRIGAGDEESAGQAAGQALLLGIGASLLLAGVGLAVARWSLRVLILSTATTVLLEPALIWGLGPLPPLGVVGSAWAFLLGYTAGLVLQVVIFVRGWARIRLRPRHLRPDLPLMRQIVRIALPSTGKRTSRVSSRLSAAASATCSTI